MPFSDEVYAAPLGATWRNYLRTFLNSLETATSAAQSAAANALSVAQSKSAKPAQGWEWADLSPTLRATLVTTGPTRPAGTGMHIWPDPTTDPGTAAQYPDRWPGDIA